MKLSTVIDVLLSDECAGCGSMQGPASGEGKLPYLPALSGSPSRPVLELGRKWLLGMEPAKQIFFS